MPSPQWLKTTADRLELAAEYAEKAGEDDEKLQALYLLNQREISEAAAAPSFSRASESPPFEAAEQEGREMKSHIETSMLQHRLTGGGAPKEGHGASGPLATAFNPNRHAMMIHGRPVVVLSVNET